MQIKNINILQRSLSLLSLDFIELILKKQYNEETAKRASNAAICEKLNTWLEKHQYIGMYYICITRHKGSLSGMTMESNVIKCYDLYSHI